MMTPDIRDRILDGLLEGLSLSAICRDIGMPSRATVQRYLSGSAPEQVAFRAAYERALEGQERMLRDEILPIIDDASGDWVERRNEDGQPFLALDPDNLKRAKLAVAAKARELDRLIRRRESAAQAEPPPVQYVITPVNFMDLPPEMRARYERASRGFL